MGLSPDRDGRVVVCLVGETVDQVAYLLVPHGEAVGFHCDANALKELGVALLEAARAIRELTVDA